MVARTGLWPMLLRTPDFFSTPREGISAAAVSWPSRDDPYGHHDPARRAGDQVVLAAGTAAVLRRLEGTCTGTPLGGDREGRCTERMRHTQTVKRDRGLRRGAPTAAACSFRPVLRGGGGRSAQRGGRETGLQAIGLRKRASDDQGLAQGCVATPRGPPPKARLKFGTDGWPGLAAPTAYWRRMSTGSAGVLGGTAVRSFASCEAAERPIQYR